MPQDLDNENVHPSRPQRENTCRDRLTTTNGDQTTYGHRYSRSKTSQNPSTTIGYNRPDKHLSAKSQKSINVENSHKNTIRTNRESSVRPYEVKSMSLERLEGRSHHLNKTGTDEIDRPQTPSRVTPVAEIPCEKNREHSVPAECVHFERPTAHREINKEKRLRKKKSREFPPSL